MKEITSIDFLVPARIAYNDGGKTIVYVDLKNRKVYQPEGSPNGEVCNVAWSKDSEERLFAKLDVVMNPPENMYANKFGSDTDVDEIQQRFETIQEEEAWETK